MNKTTQERKRRTSFELKELYAQAGWKISKWPSWIPTSISERLSCAWPISQTVFLNGKINENTFWETCTLTHEFEHIQQMSRFSRFLYSALYLVSFWNRVRFEIEAQAATALVRFRSKKEALEAFDKGIVCSRLYGVKFPYFTLHSKASVRRLYEKALEKHFG